MNQLIILAAGLPFLLLLIGVLLLRRPLWQCGMVSFGLSILLWNQVPHIETSTILTACLRAFILSGEIALILLGAISFLEYMQLTGVTSNIKQTLGRFTDNNPVVTALLLAWLFCGFLEGAAGFGAPAAVIAPLLVSLGFSPITAAILPLLGNSAAVPFGAVGTPVRIGFSGLNSLSATQYGAGINLIAGLVAPIAIFWFVYRQNKFRQNNIGQFMQGIKLAVASGLCFTLPAYALSWFGPEFPSLGGSLIGLLTFIVVIKKRRSVHHEKSNSNITEILDLLSSLSPYLLVCGLLLLGKMLLGPFRLGIEFWGFEQMIAMFQPGIAFIVAIVLLAIWRKDHSPKSLIGLASNALKQLPYVWIAIFCMAGLAQLVVSGIKFDIMPPDLLDSERGAKILAMIAPFAGALGAFVAGSATVSCLLMGPLLARMSEVFDVNTGLILGLQLVGAGAGNMISLQNLVAVQATVGLVNQERNMLRKLWFPCLLYILITALIGLILA